MWLRLTSIPIHLPLRGKYETPCPHIWRITLLWITEPGSASPLPQAWLTEIHEYAQRDVVIMLLGNKVSGSVAPANALWPFSPTASAPAPPSSRAT